LSHFKTPYSYTKPYVAKVDQIGDSLLTKFDEKIPILKSETAEIKSTARDYAHWPIKKASEGTNWIKSTYSEEYKKCGGDGVVAAGKAAITSSLRPRMLSRKRLSSNWWASVLLIVSVVDALKRLSRETRLVLWTWARC
jgi:hypothetical protein